MYLRNSLIAALALLASSVSAALVPRDIFNELLPRQTIADLCTPACAPFQTILDVCAGASSCICTTTSARDLQRCVDCGVTSSPTTSVISAAVSLVDTYKQTCKGFSVPTVTVAGSSGGTTSFTNMDFTSTALPPFISTTSTLSQVVIGPSSSPSATSSDSSSAGVLSSGYAVGVSRGIVVTIGVALGMALVY